MRTAPARLILSSILVGLIATTSAADRDVPVPPPPPLPEGAFEPEITITSEGNEIHEEYRHNGVLYMVKVTPAVGPAYYLVYDDRGRSRRSDLESDIIVPQWVIKRF